MDASPKKRTKLTTFKLNNVELVLKGAKRESNFLKSMLEDQKEVDDFEIPKLKKSLLLFSILAKSKEKKDVDFFNVHKDHIPSTLEDINTCMEEADFLDAPRMVNLLILRALAIKTSDVTEEEYATFIDETNLPRIPMSPILYKLNQSAWLYTTLTSVRNSKTLWQAVKTRLCPHRVRFHEDNCLNVFQTEEGINTILYKDPEKMLFANGMTATLHADRKTRIATWKFEDGLTRTNKWELRLKFRPIHMQASPLGTYLLLQRRDRWMVVHTKTGHVVAESDHYSTQSERFHFVTDTRMIRKSTNNSSMEVFDIETITYTRVRMSFSWWVDIGATVFATPNYLVVNHKDVPDYGLSHVSIISKKDLKVKHCLSTASPNGTPIMIRCRIWHIANQDALYIVPHHGAHFVLDLVSGTTRSPTDTDRKHIRRDERTVYV